MALIKINLAERAHQGRTPAAMAWELRLLIQDNRKLLLDVLFRAAADAILSLTAAGPLPKGHKSLKTIREAGFNVSISQKRYGTKLYSIQVIG